MQGPHQQTRTLLTPVGVVVFGVFTAAFVVAALLVDRLFGLPGLLPKWATLPVRHSMSLRSPKMRFHLRFLLIALWLAF